MSFIPLVNILLSEKDCHALDKDPSETVVTAITANLANTANSTANTANTANTAITANSANTDVTPIHSLQPVMFLQPI